MPTPNQLFVRREDVKIGARDLLNMNVPGKITEDGIRKNLAIGLGYMEAWVRGIGCVPINYLMYVFNFLCPVSSHLIDITLVYPSLGRCFHHVRVVTEP